MSQLLITGRLIDRTQQGLPGLRVEAWDKDLLCDDLVGSAITDEQGNFHMEFAESYFQELFLDRRPDLYFKVFNQKNELIISTEDSVVWNVESPEIPIEIEVYLPEEPERFVVKGNIRQEDGSPLLGAFVEAFDQDLGASPHQLGARKATNQGGYYEIAYTASEFRRRRQSRKGPNLFIRVFWMDNKVVAVSAPIIPIAKPVETINLTVSGEEFRGRSEYEKLLNQLTPILQGISLTDLRGADISVLAAESSLERQHIEFLVSATKLAQLTQLPAAVFYGFARQKLPTTLPALLAQNAQVLRRALESALRENTIPASDIDATLARLHRLAAQQALEEPQEPEKPSLGKLLNTTLFPINREQRETFAGAYLQHQGSLDDFWKELQQKPEFQQQGLIDDLKFTLQLGNLTQNYLPLVQTLQQMRREPTQPLRLPRDLARLTVNDWANLIERYGFPPRTPGRDDHEKKQNYVREIVQVIEDAFPTAAIAYRVIQENERDEDLARFWLLSGFGDAKNNPCQYLKFLDSTG